MFHFNEINKDIVDLIKRSINGEFNYKVFKPKFITREEFFAKKDTDAYIRCVWSFGNGQRSYLFGKDIEKYKESMHNAIVFNIFNDEAKKVLGMEKFNEGYSIKQRRLFYRSRQQLQQLQRLEQLEQLQRLQRLQRLERLELHSKSYNEIEIQKDAIIYCDPPYQGTAEYKEGAFNHKEFWDWVREKSKTNNVYISEYNAPNDFNSILSFEQKSTLQGGQQKHNNQPMERLFTIIK
jgi:site-specific DNA-adenine methylase